MSFNSKLFPVCFALVAALYFALPDRYRWKLLLVASYAFYMAWKPIYVIWLIGITILDYWCGLRMGRLEAHDAQRKKWLALSIGGDLALLLVFKYASFANDIVRSLASHAGLAWPFPAWHILLPLGISFHTLQTIGYSIDVYRGRREPERNLGIFALYVSFFPQMVAGPIERANHLLPQFHRPHAFDYDRAVSGLRLMLWGFFKKLVIADRLGMFVNIVYGEPAAHEGIATALATWFYAFQIYCDFSGYSDIAVGAARLLGYNLTINFNQPYFSRSIREFWHRWHISLSTWFRDYVYLPLGGNRGSASRWLANVAAVFLLSGLWHGANWTFLAWGAFHGAYYAAAQFTEPLRVRLRRPLPLLNGAFSGLAQCFITFNIVALGWIVFRAKSLGDAAQLIKNLARPNVAHFLADLHRPFSVGTKGIELSVALIATLLAIEWLTREQPIEKLWAARPLVWRWAVAYGLTIGILLLGVIAQNEFLYFQF